MGGSLYENSESFQFITFLIIVICTSTVLHCESADRHFYSSGYTLTKTYKCVQFRFSSLHKNFFYYKNVHANF